MLNQDIVSWAVRASKTSVSCDKTTAFELTILACEDFAQAEFGVSLAELLCPTMPLDYQDLYDAVNEPDFPEAAGPDVIWEKH